MELWYKGVDCEKYWLDSQRPGRKDISRLLSCHSLKGAFPHFSVSSTVPFMWLIKVCHVIPI